MSGYYGSCVHKHEAHTRSVKVALQLFVDNLKKLKQCTNQRTQQTRLVR